MTSPSSTIVIEDDELPPSWRSANLQVQRTSLRTSPEILIEPNDAASGSIEPSRKRKRAKRKQPDTLDTCFKKLRKTFDQRDQEVEKLDQKVENLEQEVEKQQKQVQELQSKLLLQEDRHQEELSRRRILDCKICYEQPDCWHNLLCGHMICEPCAKLVDLSTCPFCRRTFSGYVKCYPFAG
ncbi:unnamed protein product [Penicillium salamii]|uniref:RING-type domain-containing protein n=1 Tax=Penicillium salamii TaxID=1612424 RepID=A0A9W4N933_9EURO|nr:unnamed protein product [Penicillium salamii]CAG7988377.1 unnamed protein product [Penicillium salamii]CAG8286126.1 unnamed protein product [Penicillium salamii]CAG8288303.1 unnamed protein product [Penicillium salamii]CAG8306545.1 unnamed protein product [Penicillium salamii]